MNKKGFTMIELMATITLLGILTVIAVVSYTKYVDRTRENVYKDYEKALEVAATNYFLDHTGLLPEKNDQVGTKVSAKTLIDEGYLESMKNPKNKNETCDDNSFVVVKRKSDVGFNMNLVYRPCISCGKYVSKTCTNSYCSIVITGGTRGNNDWFKSNSVSYKLNPIGSYSSYGVTGGGVNASNMLNGRVTGEGKHIVSGFVKDSFTNKKVNCSMAINIDYTAPKCQYTGANKKWTNHNITLTRRCIDNLSGCSVPSLTIPITTSTKVYKTTSAYITDKAGNTGICSSTDINAYVDKIAPRIQVKSVRDYRGRLCKKDPDHLFKYRYDLSIIDESSNDSASGLKSITCSYGGNAGMSTSNIVDKRYTGITENICTDTSGLHCKACDYAGNCKTIYYN